MAPGRSGSMHDIQPTAISAVKLLTAKQIGDARGFLSEVYKRNALEAAGFVLDFVRENHLFSQRTGTVRSLHFQIPPFAQEKLVRVVRARSRCCGRSAPVLAHLRPSYRCRAFGGELAAIADPQGLCLRPVHARARYRGYLQGHQRCA
jgi:dTDP-4-dehydrorhamnose 3,5-epimerase